VRGPAAARGRPALTPSGRSAVLLAVLACVAGCREPPARGMRRIEGVNVEIRAVGLPRPPEAALNAAFANVTRIDGASVERAVAALRAAGARKGLVNLGGDHLAVFGEPLVVAVPDPGDPTQPRWASYSLVDRAASRARGASGPVLAVTAVAPSAAEAAALADAARPLPPREALELLVRRHAAGFVLTREGEGRFIVTTPGFASVHDLRPEEGVVVRP
jgi:hypothetical protein